MNHISSMDRVKLLGPSTMAEENGIGAGERRTGGSFPGSA